MAHSWGEYRAEQIVEHAGGVTKREFPAHLTHWDRVKNFEVWQVEWLWNGLEPQSGDTSGTRAYPTYRRIKEDLSAGLIKDAAQEGGSWEHTTLSRQQWADYALKLGERPAFLFPERRSLIRQLKERIFGEKEVSKEQRHEYHDTSIFYGAALEPNPKYTILDIDAWILGELKAGRMEAIAQPVKNGLEYPYVKIPQRYWAPIIDVHVGFYRYTFKGRDYVHFRVRQIKAKV